MTDSPDGNKPQKGEKRNGSVSPAGADKAAADGTGKTGGNATVSGKPDGGNPSGLAGAAGSPEQSHSGAKRRRRRRKRRGSAVSGQNAATSGPVPATADGTVAGVFANGAGVADEAVSLAKQETGSSDDHPSVRRKRRWRGRNKTSQRALQGNPLPVSGKKANHIAANEKGGSDAQGCQSAERSGTPRADNQRVPDNNGRARDEYGRSGYPPRQKTQIDDLYAALDLGTNNCRLLIAQPTRPGQFRVVDAFSRIVRLGEGLAANGRLSDDAMNRSVEALQVCAGKLQSRQIRLKRLIATEACRSAANGEGFLQRVLSETGLDLEIVDRETEARLAVAGCSSLVDQDTNGLVLFDIGGGSSEIAMIDLTENRSNRLANHIHAWTSLPVGVVTLSERYGGASVTRETFNAMVAEVDSMLTGFLAPNLPAFAKSADANRFHLLGTSGTVTTLAGLHLELPRYDRRKVDGIWLSSTQIDTTLEMLLGWDFDQRAANPCIGNDRADLVLAGCAILESIRKRWPSERMRVADRGLREGLLNEMMAQDGAWRRSSRRHRARMKAVNAQRGGENI